MDLRQLAIKYYQTKFSLIGNFSKKKAAQKAFELFITPQSRVTDPLPVIFQKAENLSFHFKGLKIQGYRWNHPSPKKVLILHGYESSAIYFDKYVERLLEKGYEVLAFDAPAHGRSEGKQINALDYKNLILHIIKNYGLITSFVSHSFGGLALSLALEELPHDETWKVALIAPATESSTAINRYFDFMKLDEEVRNEFNKIITNANNQPTSFYSISRAAANLKAQILFLQDEDDDITPLSDVEPIIKKNYRNFQFVISKGLGHSLIYRDAKTIEAVMDFLIS